MESFALKEKAISYITAFDEEELELAVSYLESIPRRNPIQNSKTPSQRIRARQAFDEILAMSFAGSSDISKDGAKEVSEAVMREYESLN